MTLHYSEPQWEGIYDQYGIEHNQLFYFIEDDTSEELPINIRKVKGLPNYQVVLFQFSEIPDKLVETIEFIAMFHRVKIIVFAEESKRTTEIFATLAKKGIRDCKAFPKDTSPEEYISTLERIFVSGTPYSETLLHNTTSAIQNLQAQLVKTLTIPDGFILNVGVAGAQNRVGTTTQAFMLYHVLTNMGFTPCIIDPTESFIITLLKLYEQDDDSLGSVVCIQGIHLANSRQVNSGYNAFVTDYGVLNTESVTNYLNENLSFLCAGSKPWELTPLASAFQLHSDIKNSNILFSFTAEQEEEGITEFISPSVCHFVPYNPSLWEVKDDTKYQEFLFPLVKELIP